MGGGKKKGKKKRRFTPNMASEDKGENVQLSIRKKERTCQTDGYDLFVEY